MLTLSISCCNLERSSPTISLNLIAVELSTFKLSSIYFKVTFPPLSNTSINLKFPSIAVLAFLGKDFTSFPKSLRVVV